MPCENKTKTAVMPTNVRMHGLVMVFSSLSTGE